MDIESLKLILEAVNGVSDGAVYIAILWLGLEYLKAILITAVVIFVVTVAKKLISITLSFDGFINILQARIGVSGTFFDSQKDHLVKLVDLGLEVEKHKEAK